MFINGAIILPFNLPNWKHVVNYISKINNSFEKIKSISDVVNTLRHIKYLYEGTNSDEHCQDSFLGFGRFLEKYDNEQLQNFIKINFRNILHYVQLVESLVDHSLVTLSFKNNVAKLSLAAAKSLVACSIICIMPHKVISSNSGSSDQFVNVNFDELYGGINIGSQNHAHLFHSVLQYFSSNSLDKEMNSSITISLFRDELNHTTLNETVTSWPIILTSDLSVHRITTDTVENIYPFFFDNFNLYNYSNHLAFKSDRDIGKVCPFFIPLLPLLTLGSVDFAATSVINIDVDGIQHTLYRVLPLDPWSPDLQFSLRFMETNIMDGVMAFQSVIKRYQSSDSLFASNLTDSVIEDAIHKLKWNKTREIFASNRSFSNMIDSRKIDRPSFPNIFFNSSRPRDTSISSNSSTSRSARQSYSASSSSRSGSLQLSSLSSRRSSNNSANKEIDVNGATDKADFSTHGCHPIILEESNIQMDEDECLLLHRRHFQEFPTSTDCLIAENQFHEMMSAPISDSKKLSLSKDYLRFVGEKSPQSNCVSKRRNSSPIFGSMISQELYKNTYAMAKSEMKPISRCCEADASDNRLSEIMWARSSSHGRRQSLPCHLQWVYRLPLTDSIKLDLSQSQMLTKELNESLDSINTIKLDWPDKFVENCFLESSNVMLISIVNLANDLLDNILPSEARREDQVELRREILKCRSKTLEDEGKYVVINESLHEDDLSLFYKELCSTTLFVDEDFQYFRNLSNIKSTYNVSHETLCYVHSVKDHTSHLEKYESLSKKDSLIDYVNQLTDTIIAEAILQGTNVAKSRDINQFNNYADNVSVDIIAGALAELAANKKTTLKSINQIYIKSFPFCYRTDLAMLLQILSACISQHQTGQILIIVCDYNGNHELTEIIDIINKNRDRLTPCQMFSIMIKYYSSRKTMKQMKFKEFLLSRLPGEMCGERDMSSL